MMFMIRPFMTVIMRLMIFFNSPLKVPVQKSSEYQNFSTLFESGGGTYLRITVQINVPAH